MVATEIPGERQASRTGNNSTKKKKSINFYFPFSSAVLSQLVVNSFPDFMTPPPIPQPWYRPVGMNQNTGVLTKKTVDRGGFLLLSLLCVCCYLSCLAVFVGWWGFLFSLFTHWRRFLFSLFTHWWRFLFSLFTHWRRFLFSLFTHWWRFLFSLFTHWRRFLFSLAFACWRWFLVSFVFTCWWRLPLSCLAFVVTCKFKTRTLMTKTYHFFFYYLLKQQQTHFFSKYRKKRRANAQTIHIPHTDMTSLLLPPLHNQPLHTWRLLMPL